MALALHAARRPTLLFEVLDYPRQSLNFLFLESFVVQPQLRIQVKSWDTERSEQSVSSPFNVFSAFARVSLLLGRDSSGALLGFEPLYARGFVPRSSAYPARRGGHVPLPEHFFYDVRWFFVSDPFSFSD